MYVRAICAYNKIRYPHILWQPPKAKLSKAEKERLKKEEAERKAKEEGTVVASDSPSGLVPSPCQVCKCVYRLYRRYSVGVSIATVAML